MDSTIKKINYFLIICILTLICVSCDSDEEPEQNTEQPGAYVATIDGETIDFLYQPRAVLATCNDTPCVWLDGRTSDFSKEFNITILNLTTTGTYDIGGTSNNTSYYSFSPPEGGIVTAYGTSSEGDPSGEVNVTSYNGNTIKGNFNFILIRVDDPSIELPVSGTFDLIVSD